MWCHGSVAVAAVAVYIIGADPEAGQHKLGRFDSRLLQAGPPAVGLELVVGVGKREVGNGDAVDEEPRHIAAIRGQRMPTTTTAAQ